MARGRPELFILEYGTEANKGNEGFIFFVLFVVSAYWKSGMVKMSCNGGSSLERVFKI
jgi:hypothetical protein